MRQIYASISTLELEKYFSKYICFFPKTYCIISYSSRTFGTALQVQYDVNKLLYNDPGTEPDYKARWEKKSIYDWVIISLEKLVQNFETMKSNLII